MHHPCLPLFSVQSATCYKALTGKNCMYFLTGFMKRLIPSLRPVRRKNTSEVARVVSIAVRYR